MSVLVAFSFTLNAGELAEKAEAFDRIIAENHIPRGMIVNLRPVSHKNNLVYTSFGDSTIWTGAYIASQVYRYHVTRDAASLQNIEKCLKAFVVLYEMAGETGFIGRAYGTREELGNGHDILPGVASYSHLFFKADTSRDQYTGIFLGCGLAWPLIQDNLLRKQVQTMIRTAATNLMNNNLSLKVKFSDFSPSTFDLNPDYAYQDRINPQEWEKVDDFPANVLAQSIPYSERLANIISRFKPPPVRGGEALRALMMFQTAVNITQDNELKTFLCENLIEKRQLHIVASEASRLLEDVYLGRNQKVVHNRLDGIFTALGIVTFHVFSMKATMPDSISLIIEPAIWPFISFAARSISHRLLQIVTWFRNPVNFALFASIAKNLEDTASSLEKIGLRKPAQRLKKKALAMKTIALSSLDEFADTMRSYVGCNLGFFALLGILDQPGDKRLRQSALSILPASFESIADEGNSLYTFIAAAFGDTLPETIIESAKKTMRLYPTDCLNKKFDHREKLRPSPWPDRFGKYGRQSIEVIPINLRAPHVFIWQQPPREMVSGSDNGTRIAPVGYLLAYWFARHHQLLSEKD